MGILTEEDPVELLEGCLVLKMGINPKHWYATGQLRDWLIGLGLTNYFIHSQEPIVINLEPLDATQRKGNTSTHNFS